MLVLACLTLLVWAYLLFFHAWFWQVRRFQLPSAGSRQNAKVAVIVPARNEAEVIGRAVSSLLHQDFAGELRVFVVDDSSTDGTANVARAAAARSGSTYKVTVIPGSELAPGWTGKVWAMHQGWLAAREGKPDFVLFTDADIEHGSRNLAQLLSQADRGYDLVSLMVRLRCENLREKFLIPAFVYFFFLLYPPRRIADPRSAAAGAAGGCMLVRSTVLEQIGGLEAIANEIIDDCALGRVAKRSGARIWLGVTQETRSIRPYVTLSNIRDMIARTAFNQLRYSKLLLFACLVGMAIVFIAPLALIWGSNAVAGWISLLACLMMFVSYVPILGLYRVNRLAAVTLPFAAIFYMYATMFSAWKHWRGQSGEWKGRVRK